MRKIPILLTVLLLALSVFAIPDVHTVRAADDFPTFEPLVVLPFITTSVGGKSVTNVLTYLPGAMKLLIGVAGALAVIMIMFAGFQYISSDGVGTKSNAREKINNALLGLLLAIGAYTILNTINPALVNLNLDIQKYSPPAPSTTASSTDLQGTGANTGGPWQKDDTERLILFRAGININNPNCTVIGQRGCTSVFGIGGAVMSGLIDLKNQCVKQNSACVVVVTGGTEYWLHSATTKHKPGGNVADIRLNNALLEFLRSKSQGVNVSGNCSTGVMYTYNGARYVDEKIDGNAPHFHVCYY